MPFIERVKIAAFVGSGKRNIDFSFEDVEFEMPIRHLNEDVDRQLEI